MLVCRLRKSREDESQLIRHRGGLVWSFRFMRMQCPQFGALQMIDVDVSDGETECIS